LLGRGHELAVLEGGLDDLSAGRGALYLIVGEPGIGKTRLADEAARAAAARSVPVRWGRAWEVGGAPPFWPFIQVLRGLGEELPASRDRFELFDRVVQTIHRAAPLVLVLDDLHAADRSSLELLHFLARDLRDHHVLVLGTYREAEARLATEVGRALTRIAREATVLPLRRLDRGEVADFVAEVTGAAAPADRIDALLRRTEGNPLFLGELLRLRQDTGRVPDGIHEVVRARLALLPEAARAALEVAAVVGREFAPGDVAALTGTRATEAIAAAADAGLVESIEGGRWRFTHVLLREGLHDDLPAARRRALHHAAGRLAGLPRSDVAHHLLAAIPDVPIAEAVDAAAAAADDAMAALAFEDACALRARTVALLDGVDGESHRRFDALLGLGIARIHAAELAMGKDACHRAAALARDLGDGERFARAVLAMTFEFTPGLRDQPTVDLLEEALAGLPPGDGALRARCMGQLAAERQPEPDPEEAFALARDAVAMARRVDDPGALRATLGTAAMAMLISGHPRERRQLNAEILALATGDRMAAMRAHLFLASALAQLGELDDSDAEFRAYDAAWPEFRHPRFGWVTLAMAAVRALRDGRLDDAARLTRDTDASSEPDESRGASTVALPIAVARAVDRGDADVTAIEASVRARLGPPASLVGCFAELLIAHLHGRDRIRATAQLATVRAHPRFATLADPTWLVFAAEACHQAGDVALAARIYDGLAPRAAWFCTLGPLGPFLEPPYARQLGLLALTLGRVDAAVAHLDDALVRTERAGLRAQLARLRVELAGALVARGGPGDRARADTLRDQARALAAELDQRALLASLGDGRAAVAAIPSFALVREGDAWAVSSGNRTVRLRDSRGLQVLAQLIGSPGVELHVLQLVSPDDDGGRDRGDAGELIDAAAIQRYRARLLELREDLEEAEAFADAGRAARARSEIDALTEELARGVGLGGRARRAGNPAERARTAVQKRLRGAIDRIADALPELAHHLEQTIRTGVFCGYLPEGRRRRRRPG